MGDFVDVLSGVTSGSTWEEDVAGLNTGAAGDTGDITVKQGFNTTHMKGQKIR